MTDVNNTVEAMVVLNKDEIAVLADHRLTKVYNLINASYYAHDIKNPQATIDHFRKAISVYFEAERLLEKLTEGEHK